MKHRRDRIFAEKPCHPNSRAVIGREPEGVLHKLSLECGHSVRRRFYICDAARIICNEC